MVLHLGNYAWSLSEGDLVEEINTVLTSGYSQHLASLAQQLETGETGRFHVS